MATRFAIAAIIAIYVIPQAVKADEIWVCNFPKSNVTLTRYWLHEKYFSEVKPYWPFHVLTNTDLAIVAASGTGIEAADVGRDKNSDPLIGIEMIAIDRKTGTAIEGSISLYGDTKAADHGSCHLQTHDDPDAVWPPNMQDGVGPKLDENHGVPTTPP